MPTQPPQPPHRIPPHENALPEQRFHEKEFFPVVLSLLNSHITNSLWSPAILENKVPVHQENPIMAEAFALGATVASVVGFAGQVLQGCLAIRAFLDDLEDAPVYIEDLKSILAIFEASLTNLKSTVSEDNASVELRPALEYSDKCIRDLEGMIRKLRDGDPDWERNLSAVRWKSKIMKLVENLKTARALLTGVQMNRVNVGL
jgi:hypothetical protein